MSVPQMLRVTVFQLELTWTSPRSCEPLRLRVVLWALIRHRDSRQAIYENALTGRPCSANFGSHCGHRFDLSFGTPAGSISTTLDCGSRVSWVWVAGKVWVDWGACA